MSNKSDKHDQSSFNKDPTNSNVFNTEAIIVIGIFISLIICIFLSYLVVFFNGICVKFHNKFKRYFCANEPIRKSIKVDNKIIINVKRRSRIYLIETSPLKATEPSLTPPIDYFSYANTNNKQIIEILPNSISKGKFSYDNIFKKTIERETIDNRLNGINFNMLKANVKEWSCLLNIIYNEIKKNYKKSIEEYRGPNNYYRIKYSKGNLFFKYVGECNDGFNKRHYKQLGDLSKNICERLRRKINFWGGKKRHRREIGKLLDVKFMEIFGYFIMNWRVGRKEAPDMFLCEVCVLTKFIGKFCEEHKVKLGRVVRFVRFVRKTCDLVCGEIMEERVYCEHSGRGSY